MTALLADLRKALISPNEDFVVMVPLANQDKTRVIGADDLNQIKKQTAKRLYRSGVDQNTGAGDR